MQSTEGKAARAIGNALDKSEFDPGVFVYVFMTNQPVTIRLRLWAIMLRMIEAYAQRYITGNVMNEDELHAAAQAARFVDTMRQFGELP
jgi:hypothetical protein